MDTHSVFVSAQEHLVRRRGRAQGGSRSSQVQPTTSLPSALPCRNFYARFPHRVGPTGNVIMTSEEELQTWLLVARPVTRQEAEEHGGCIIFPSLSRCGKRTSLAEAQYYCITDTDDTIYGRAEYIPITTDCEVIIEEAAETFTNAFDHEPCVFGDDVEEDEAEFAQYKRRQECTKYSPEHGSDVYDFTTTVCGRG